MPDGGVLGGFFALLHPDHVRHFFPRLPSRGPSKQNAGSVPAFFLFTIGGSAPGASCLVLGLDELGAFAVNLGRLSIARFDGMAGVGSRGC